jgi:hypothetical protein
MARHRLFLAALLLGLAAVGTAHAGDHTLVVSTKPYWQVGPRDDILSRSCSLGRFNPARAGRYVARFTGKQGSDVLDIAKGNGVNLWDPQHHGKPGEDYYFRNQGTTVCEVFVGGRKGPTKPP